MTVTNSARLLPQPLLLLLLWLTAALPALAAQDIELEIDRNPVRINESFQLTFIASEDPDEDPDFSPLQKDFDIINKTQSSRVSMIQGNFSKEIQWTLTLMPKTAGRIIIPSVAFGSSQTQPREITIEQPPEDDGTARADIFIEAELAPKDAWVQSQLIYTLRILSRYQMSGSLLSEPAPENALVSRLGKDRNYTTTRGGERFQVIERHYAIFPQSSGELVIQPLDLDAEVMLPPSRNGNRLSRYRPQLKRLTTPEFRLDIKPAPASFSGNHWLPAENLQIEQRWSGDFNQIRAGEPLTRTVTLMANGVLSSQLPELQLGTPLDAGGQPAGNVVKYYPDQPSKEEKQRNSGITSYREEKFAIIATTPGTYILPAVEIPWWNTTTNKMETARLAETTITVIPGADASTTSPAETSAPATESGATVTSEEGDTMGTTSGVATGWRWLALALALGWACNGLYWWRNRNTDTPESRKDKHSEDSRAGFTSRKLENACRANQAAETRRQLLQWSQQQWPDERINSLGQLERLCPPALAASISELNRTLYSRNGSISWTGDSLWMAFQEATREMKQQSRGGKPGSGNGQLASLYK